MNPDKSTPPALVIFACVHNAGRSQMAAAFFNSLADPSRCVALSAGTRPATAVQPEVVEAMRDAGIDVSGAKPRLLTAEMAREASLLVTMGCGEECPRIPGLRRADWPIPDPKGRPPQQVREIRDTVRALVAELIAGGNCGRSDAGSPDRQPA